MACKSLNLGALVLVSALIVHAQRIAPSAQKQIAALLSEKASRSGVQRKMSARLVHAAKVARGDRIHTDFPTPPDALSSLRLDARRRVEVDIRAEVTPALLAYIEAVGGSVVNSFPEYHSIRANLPLLAVEWVASSAGVAQVWPSEVEVNSGGAPSTQNVADKMRRFFTDHARQSQGIGRFARGLNSALFAGPNVSGDIAHQANIARTTYGVDGTGVKVGVLSGGADSIVAEQAAGRLPNVQVIAGQRGSGNEGTALLEIIYTLAPGATLYFATASGGTANMANNIQALADAGCKIIVDDVFYPSEGVFQDGIIARKVNALAAAGVFYFSAAGNKGRVEAFSSDTWEGDFVDSGSVLGPIPAGTSIHRFGVVTGNRINIPSPVGVYSVNWSDPFGRATNDYDLFILNPDMTAVVASSTDVQNGTQDPQEHIDDPTRRVVAGDWIVIVRNPGAAARALHLDTWLGRIAQSTNGNTVGHNAAEGAFSIAAVDVHLAFGGAFTGNSISVENFSSSGPRRMFIRPDGTAFTPGNFLFSTAGGLLLNKPDFAAADGVVTGVPPYNPFYGTSAAAPHAAAIAALMVQANPSLTVTQMRIALASSALFQGPYAGAGIIMAPAAIAQAPQKCTYSIGPGGRTHSSSSDSGSIAVTTQAICPWSVSTSDAWIIPDSSSPNPGLGNGTGNYHVLSNSGDARWGSIAIADQRFTVEQDTFQISGALNAGSLAQVVSAGNWKMTLAYLNLGNTPAQLQASFRDDNGRPLVLPFTFPQLSPTGAPLLASMLQRSLPAGAQFVIETTGPASQLTAVGWGQLAGSGNLAGFGIFSNSATKGEAVVPLESRHASKYILAFDNTGGWVTGMAVANVSSTSDAYVSTITRDETGAEVTNGQMSFSPLGHTTLILSDSPPGTGGTRGTVEFDTPPGGQISVLGLRFSPSSLFTTIPVFANVTPGGGSMAHLASGGGWDSTITLVNVGPAPAEAQLAFFDDSGKPLSLPLIFPPANSPAFSAPLVVPTLAANASFVVETTGPENQAVRVGSVQLMSKGNISGFIVFHRTSDGQEAVVPLESRNASSYILPFDNIGGLVAGVAVANGSTQAANIPVVIRDDNGTQIGTGAITLLGNGHSSFVLTDRFSITANRRGTIEFDAPTGQRISVLGLRFTEQGFTTIPVFAK